MAWPEWGPCGVSMWWDRIEGSTLPTSWECLEKISVNYTSSVCLAIDCSAVRSLGTGEKELREALAFDSGACEILLHDSGAQAGSVRKQFSAIAGSCWRRGLMAWPGRA